MYSKLIVTNSFQICAAQVLYLLHLASVVPFITSYMYCGTALVGYIHFLNVMIF
jgi:hypothetical protein